MVEGSFLGHPLRNPPANVFGARRQTGLLLGGKVVTVDVGVDAVRVPGLAQVAPDHGASAHRGPFLLARRRRDQRLLIAIEVVGTDVEFAPAPFGAAAFFLAAALGAVFFTDLVLVDLAGDLTADVRRPAMVFSGMAAILHNRRSCWDAHLGVAGSTARCPVPAHFRLRRISVAEIGFSR